MTDIEISRTAQCVAMGLFLMGKCASVRFNTPNRIGAKCKEGLDELVKNGMITFKKEGKTFHYQATDKIGNPRKYKAIDESNEEEMFAIVTDDKDLQWKSK